MKFKNTLLLFIVLVLLGGYVYLKEFKGYAKKEKLKAESSKLFHFKQDSIYSIDIANPNGRFAFQREDQGWEITAPLRTEADQGEVNGIVSNLTGAKKDKQFTVKESELGDYGLTGKTVRVLLATKKGEKDSAVFGDKTPVGEFVFASKGDTTVFTVNNSVKSTLNKRLFDWREKRLLQFQRAQIKKIILTTPKGKYTFVKQDGGEWEIENIHRPANSGRVNEVLNKIEYNRIREFVDEEGKQLRKYGLVKPAFEVEFLLGKELAQKNLKISRKIKGNYYALDESRKPIFRIDSTLVHVLDRTLTDFRGHDFASIDRDKVNRIVIQYNETLLTVLKDSTGAWILDAANRPKVKPAKITPLMSDVDFALIKKFVADDHFNAARYGLDKPRLRARFYQDDDLLLDVKFGKLEGKDVYAMTNQYKSVYLVKKSTMDKLKIRRDDIIEKPKEKKEAAAAK